MSQVFDAAVFMAFHEIPQAEAGAMTLTREFALEPSAATLRTTIRTDGLPDQVMLGVLR
jgi:hypothetical protein